MIGCCLWSWITNTFGGGAGAPPSWADTKSFLLNGTDEYMGASVVGDLDPGKGTPFSWSAWIKSDSITVMALFSSLGAAPDYTGREVRINRFSQRLEFELTADSDGADFIRVQSAGGAIASTGWMHVAGTYDGSGNVSGMNIYLNGANINGSTTGTVLTGDPSGGVPMCVGKRPGGALQFDGNINEPVWYDKELSLAEIQEIYNAGSPEDPQSLSTAGNILHYWRAEDASGTNVPDSVGSLDLTMTNMTAAENAVADVP